MKEYDYRLIIGYLECSISDEEIKYLLEKVHSDKDFEEAFNQIAEIWSEREKNVTDTNRAQSALDRLHQRIELSESQEIPYQGLHVHPSKKSRSFSKIGYGLAAAAAIAVVFTGLHFYSNLPFTTQKIIYITKTTGPGQKMRVKLPDGSSVFLNTLSSVQIPENYGAENREVILKGEGWFEVEKNPEKPFIVHAGKIRTLVLGTKFNVSAYRDDSIATVSLVEGKVQVDMGDDAAKRQILKPGDQLIYTRKDSTAIVRSFIKESAVGWKDNILSFDYDTWPNAARKISRWYGVKVKLEDEGLMQCRLKGSFAGLPLTDVLKRLSYISGIKWKIDGKTIYISGKCNQ